MGTAIMRQVGVGIVDRGTRSYKLLGLFIVFDLNVLIKHTNMVDLSRRVRILKLPQGTSDIELTALKESSVGCQNRVLDISHMIPYHPPPQESKDTLQKCSIIIDPVADVIITDANGCIEEPVLDTSFFEHIEWIRFLCRRWGQRRQHCGRF